MAYVFREYRSRGKPWCIAYKGVDGRMRREKTDAPTKELARKLLAKKLVELTEAKVAGITVEQTPIAFTEFMKEYRRHIEGKKTPQSIGRDDRSIQHLTKVFGSRQLRQVTTGMVQKYVDDRMHEKKRGGKPYRPATVNREIMCLSAIFREAIKRGYADRNPVRGVKQMAEDNIIVRYLSLDEETALLDACTPNLKPIVLCALHSGMRRGEILKLKWEDVDLDQLLIRVKLTKSKKTRYIPINTKLHEVLKAVPKLDDCPYVFANPETHDRWCDQNTAWNYTLKRSGVKNFRFHDLRHTFASRLVQAGESIKSVQELLGHASLQVTLRYAHLSASDLRRAVEVLTGQKNTTQPATQTPPAQGAQSPSDATPSKPKGLVGPPGLEPGTKGL